MNTTPSQPGQYGSLDAGNLDGGVFRAYDIRGITTQNLTASVVYWVGRGFAGEAQSRGQQTVVIGRDGRLSSHDLQNALAQGLQDGGCDVIAIGEIPTPILYYATHVLETGTGIMITGSHNPPEYNGLKMMIGGVTLAEDRIQAILRRLQNADLPEGNGTFRETEVHTRYLREVTDKTKMGRSLKVVVDCGNGVAGELAPQLLNDLGCTTIPLFCEIDGHFPNHHPDPAEPENLADLMAAVRENNADIGLAFDGDGDRLGIVTATGAIIWPDRMIMLFAEDLLQRNPGAEILYDVKCSSHLPRIITAAGGTPTMWKTGHSHMKAKLKSCGALLAGEFSGHICFAENWYGFDDALYTAAIVLRILSQSEQDADGLFAGYPDTFSTPEIKITTTETRKFEVMAELAERADFGDGELTEIDGIRVDFADGFGLIRPSNTSPVLSLRFEGDSPEALQRIMQSFKAQLALVDKDLTFA